MLTSMLEKAIEIEGLLRIIRDGNPLPETYTLLTKKTAELSEQAAGLEVGAETLRQEEPLLDFVMAPPPAAPAQPEVVFKDEEPTLKNQRQLQKGEADKHSEVAQETAPEDLALEEEDDIILTFDDSHDEDFTEESTDIKTTEQTETDEEDPEGGETETDSDYQNTSDNSEATESEEEATETTMISDTETEEPEPLEKAVFEVEAPTSTRRHGKLKPAFSLNDRFLYARELFGGNMKTFDSTIEQIEGIEDYSGIEDFCYNDLKWNREDSHVSAFMEVVRLWCL
ncbi:MAG: hypothetical protein K2N48_02800 [Muribaculaceae bacterium]|nr:hypothetical protein [Muribaculaceae bacterium]